MRLFRKQWPIHLLGWLLFISLPVTIIARDPGPDTEVRLLTSASFWLFVLVYCAFFYINLLYWLPKLYLKKRYVLYSFVFGASFLTVYVGKPFETLLFSKFHRQETELPPMPRYPGPLPEKQSARPLHPDREGGRREPAVDFVSLVLFVMTWVIAMFVRISEQWGLSEKKVLQSEADKAQAELYFFKAQINPHFLFNTLNNIYSMAVSRSEHTAPSILKLSAMMRYITEQATENFVPLQEEVTCLENYIALQKLRLTDKTRVSTDFGPPDTNTLIAPLILMTFVENAFKYGVSNHHRSEITIRLSVHAGELLFFCQNQIFGQVQVEGREGVGISNTRKRLDFLYPDRYRLDIEEHAPFYTVQLKLDSHDMRSY
ncbi:sensor histidine kinase [Dyadobacter sandarakinus]|uniref:Sensor histidine kinase n=1 Tax=Dyadobacter sandarakinus TaxID=2747268 RepID=A0ABX7IAC6_9BACT|nr:sensor histidine kinase [Dyadobacter sandarakinus]QRR02865.1 sensor histidine kinase [Dyadobacter sandarakinus]